MRKFGLVIVLAAICLSSAATKVSADAQNVRPLLSGAGTFNNASLQTIFDGISTSAGDIDTIADQSSAALFTNDASGASIATFIIELAGNASTNTFGIYKMGDESTKALIFSGPQTVGSQATVSFQLNGTVKVTLTDGTGSPVVVSEIAGFGSNFGFYLGVDANTTYYSEDSLNPNQDAQALIYQGENEYDVQIDPFAGGLFSDSEFIIAFEDIEYGSSDKDFNDLVVLVESITPVPAPGAFVLGAMGLGLVGWVRRRYS